MTEGSGANPPDTSTTKQTWSARFSAARRRVGQRLHRIHAVTRISLAVLILTIVALAVGLTNSASIRDSVHWKFWLQVATSNWSPDQPKHEELTEQEKKDGKTDKDYIGDSEYAVGAVMALVVNLGSFVLIFGTIYQIWKTERNRAVETSTAYQFRDINLQQAMYWFILNNFATSLKEDDRALDREKLATRIQDIFNESNKKLPADIQAGFGEAGAQFLKEHADDLIRPTAEADQPGITL